MTTQAEMMTQFAAFLAAQAEPAETPMGKARKENAEKMRVNKAPATEVYEAKADTLPALREAAVDGYGAVVRYGAGMNDVFGKGWPLVTKESDPERFAKIEAERKTFIAYGKSRGLVNPAVHWKNAKGHALVASGDAVRGTKEARSVEAVTLDKVSSAYITIVRDAANREQPAKLTKARELIEGAIQLLGGTLEPLKAQAAKPLPGQPKGS